VITIDIGSQQDGHTFMLDPWTRQDYRDHRIDCVFMGSDHPERGPHEFAGLADDPWGRWRIIASMLTGIPVPDLPTLRFRQQPGGQEIQRL